MGFAFAKPILVLLDDRWISLGATHPAGLGLVKYVCRYRPRDPNRLRLSRSAETTGLPGRRMAAPDMVVWGQT
jgi:hypothetical protein